MKNKNNKQNFTKGESKIKNKNQEVEEQLSVNLDTESPIVEEKSPIVEEKSPVVEEKRPIVEEESPVEEDESPSETETEEADEENEEDSDLVTGKLDNCAKLYVRKEANKESDDITTIDDKDILLINIEESTEDFYKVEVKGFIGYCMKKFIKID